MHTGFPAWLVTKASLPASATARLKSMASQVPLHRVFASKRAPVAVITPQISKDSNHEQKASEQPAICSFLYKLACQQGHCFQFCAGKRARDRKKTKDDKRRNGGVLGS